MPRQINVSLQSGADVSKLEEAKKKVTDQGGKIVNEFKLVKGFTAELPDDKVSVLETDSHINVENNGEVKTQ